MKKLKFKTLLIVTLFLVNFSKVFTQTQFIREYNLNYSYTTDNLEQQTIDKDGNGYIFGGPTYKGTYTGTGTPINLFDAKIIKVNTDGSLSPFSKIYRLNGPLGGFATFTIGSVKKINSIGGLLSSGYLISGVVSIGENLDSKKEYGAMIRTDLAGNIMWKKRYSFIDAFSNNQAFFINQVTQVSNGKIIAVGYTRYFSHNNIERTLMIMKLNPSTGTVDWHKDLNSKSMKRDMSARGIIEGKSGEYYIYGDGYSTKSINKGFVIKLTDGYASPSFTDMREIGIIPAGMEVLEDELLVYGEVQKDSRKTIGIFKMNSDMNVVTNLPGLSNHLTVYFWENHTSDYLPCDILINNGKIVLSALKVKGGGTGYTFGTPINILISPSGTVINTTEGNTSAYYKRTNSMFNSIDSYVATDKLTTKRYRLTSRTTDGNTCNQDKVNKTADYTKLGKITPDFYSVKPKLKTEILDVSIIDSITLAASICEKCDINSEDYDSITTSTGLKTFCQGQNIDLIGPSGFVNYVWYRNGEPFGTGNPISITDEGTYSVMCYDANDCEIEKFIAIETIDGCYISGLPILPLIEYCSISPDINYVGWETDPLADCNYSYFYNWQLNGVSLPWTPGGNFRTEIIGEGIYTVSIAGPCGTLNYSKTIVDNLVDTSGVPEANFTITSCIFDNIYLTTTASSYDEYIWEVNNLTTGDDTTIVLYHPSSLIYEYACNSNEFLEITLTLISYSDCKIYRNTHIYADGPGFIDPNFANTSPPTKMKIFPNPAKDFLNVKLDNSRYKTSIFILKNSLGNLVQKTKILQKEEVIDISNLANGIYSAHLIIDNQLIEVQQVIIQH